MSEYVFENENEALERGKRVRIFDGRNWYIGILWKTQDMVNRNVNYFYSIRLEEYSF